MEIIDIYSDKVKEVVSKKEFIKRYNKSVDNKKDNCSLVDTTQIQPQRNNYKTKDMTVDIIGEKYYDSSFPLNANLGNFLKKMFDNCYIHYRNKYSILNELHSHSIRNVLLQKTKPGEGYHKWHCENDHTARKDRVCAFMLYLNDVEEGGKTEFLYQNIKIKPEEGKLLIWPAQFTHTHRGNSPISNNKYILTGWIEYV